MRIPFRTETDAFRVAVALVIVGGLSILVGVLTSRAYGVVLFAAGLAAGITFELTGREGGPESALQRAAHGPHPHGAVGGRRHLLIVACERLRGDDLRRQLEVGGADAELDVLAPILSSRSHHLAGDVDRERAEARVRLDASLAWAGEQGFTARGEVGDADPLAAIEDELRDFGADEVVIVMHARERTSWLARRMLGHLARELDVPVREVVLGEEEKSPAPPPATV
jgi:hypothetical protein